MTSQDRNSEPTPKASSAPPEEFKAYRAELYAEMKAETPEWNYPWETWIEKDWKGAAGRIWRAAQLAQAERDARIAEQYRSKLCICEPGVEPHMHPERAGERIAAAIRTASADGERGK